jgi:2-polyprenyl-6-methoxyphenol hydroxylase-like FAD-dependent oxidoreductase
MGVERIAQKRVYQNGAVTISTGDAMTRSDVLIVGAGPTGLVLALWLTKLGAKVRIVDKTAAPGTTSRALAVHARTLELYRQLDLADTVIARGHKVPAVNLWVGGAKKTTISFENVGADITPYPFLHIFPQDEHEKLLISRLAYLGVSVERSVECIGFEDRGERVIARLRRADKSVETCQASWLAGCDGADSMTRKTLGVGFPGGDYSQIFYVADVDALGPPMDGELHVDLDQADFLAVFPLAGQGRARLVGAIRGERFKHPEFIQFEDISPRAIENLDLSVRKVNWFSHYHVHHRVAEHFRKGRVFLLGDAAHIHSPAGGQGMNTGIGDAINLAWKLQSVMTGLAPETLLDSYEEERIGFAHRLVHTTDRMFTLASEGFRKWLFRNISQVSVSYRDCPLNSGYAGKVRGGDRLPWVESVDNHKSLAEMRWQIHVYGEAPADLDAWRRRYELPMQVFDWRDDYRYAGLMRNALYLMRPDGYVALASPVATAEALARYLTARRIRF